MCSKCALRCYDLSFKGKKSQPTCPFCKKPVNARNGRKAAKDARERVKQLQERISAIKQEIADISPVNNAKEESEDGASSSDDDESVAPAEEDQQIDIRKMQEAQRINDLYNDLYNELDTLNSGLEQVKTDRIRSKRVKSNKVQELQDRKAQVEQQIAQIFSVDNETGTS